jgi:hypothetical protein
MTKNKIWTLTALLLTTSPLAVAGDGPCGTAKQLRTSIETVSDLVFEARHEDTGGKPMTASCGAILKALNQFDRAFLNTLSDQVDRENKVIRQSMSNIRKSAPEIASNLRSICKTSGVPMSKYSYLYQKYLNESWNTIVSDLVPGSQPLMAAVCKKEDVEHRKARKLAVKNLILRVAPKTAAGTPAPVVAPPSPPAAVEPDSAKSTDAKNPPARTEPASPSSSSPESSSGSARI